MPHLSHPSPRGSIGCLLTFLFVFLLTHPSLWFWSQQPASFQKSALRQVESYTLGELKAPGSSHHFLLLSCLSHIFSASPSRGHHLSQSFVRATPCDHNTLPQALCRARCFSPSHWCHNVTCSFSDHQSPSLPLFHSMLYFFLVLLVVYNYFIYLLTFSLLLGPLTSSQASKRQEPYLFLSFWHPQCQYSARAQLMTAHQVSIPLSCAWELDTDEKVCPFVKVNDCSVGPLKTIHKN